MIYLLQRYSDNTKSTQGNLFLKEPDFKWLCHTLEDESRDQKLIHETRIDAGFYELKIRKDETPLTLKHRQTYNIKPFGNWFKYHIEITNLPRHTGVYFHAGNKDTHTSGCPLLGDTIGNHMIEEANLARSIQATKRFYDICYPQLDAGNRAWVEIRDEKHLLK